MNAAARLVTEAEILKSILATLHYLGVECWRQNVGSFSLEGPSNRRRYFKSGSKGMSDVIGLLGADFGSAAGKFLAVEVKRPGARPSPEQYAFLAAINEAGGLAFWATSAEDVERVILAVRGNPALRIMANDDGSMDLTDEEV